MQDKKYFNVYYFDFAKNDFDAFVDEIRRQLRITVRDNQWKDISVEDFEIVLSEKNQVSDTKPYRVNVIRESSIYKRVIDTLTVAMYGLYPEKEMNNVWPETLQKDELVVVINYPTEDDTVAIATTTLRYLLSKYVPTRISATSLKTCATSTVRKMFTHFGMKSQVTKWSDKQI